MLRTVETIDSTNAELARRWEAGEAADGDALRAHHQTSGRGRLGRSFIESPGEALLVSILRVLPDSANLRGHVGWLTLGTGLAMVSALQPVAGGRVNLKWPNDIMLDGHKLGGILGELLDPTGGDLPVVLGCGINTSGAPVPGSISLSDAGFAADAETVAEILDRFRVEVDARVDAVVDNRIDELHAELTEHCTTPGREVRVTTAGGSTIEGIARQIDIDGALIVDTGTDRVRVSGADADLI
nr:biotin--[acetyl-CoA-carboxylase] ligase [Flaviflexus huanghaiensis]